MRGRQELAQEDTVENEEQDPETIRAQEDDLVETREGAVRQHLTDTNKVYYDLIFFIYLLKLKFHIYFHRGRART